MASITPQLETCSSESDKEAMEQIALSESPIQDIANSSTNNNIKGKPELHIKIAENFGNFFASLRENLLVVKRVVQNLWLQYIRGEKSDRIRAYQVWPGNNVFFFHGRFICGPDPRGLLLTTTSIILSSWIFAMYIGDELPSHSSTIVTISVILTVFINLILVSATDPGIIPRNDQAIIEDVGTSDGTRSKRVMINGVEMKLKYCRICKIFRPPRSCHCAACDNCVEKFDHHCPWIGQCIALRNYRFYLSFVISALVLFAYLFAFSVWRIHAKSKSGLLGMLKNCPETVALVSFSFAAIWFLAGLAIFHIYLIAVNQTAYENFRQRYADSQNPYDKGIVTCCKCHVVIYSVPMSAKSAGQRAAALVYKTAVNTWYMGPSIYGDTVVD
ncbi:S-acyltransferase [Citrus sinensis]|uniref:S-acyltransferase n=1 Tax=Citrus sinensis TaxID=2711 RepID=A0ACB8N5F4_CITSI|nr:S-acyltransferase [Citrus sinensis]